MVYIFLEVCIMPTVFKRCFPFGENKSFVTAKATSEGPTRNAVIFPGAQTQEVVLDKRAVQGAQCDSGQAFVWTGRFWQSPEAQLGPHGL